MAKSGLENYLVTDDMAKTLREKTGSSLYSFSSISNLYEILENSDYEKNLQGNYFHLDGDYTYLKPERLNIRVSGIFSNDFTQELEVYFGLYMKAEDKAQINSIKKLNENLEFYITKEFFILDPRFSISSPLILKDPIFFYLKNKNSILSGLGGLKRYNRANFSKLGVIDRVDQEFLKSYFTGIFSETFDKTYEE